MFEKVLILASKSITRATLLKQAGVVFTQRASNLDEAEIKKSLLAESCSTNNAAEVLAELKAKSVAQSFPDSLVLGLDTMIEADAVWLEKPKTPADVKMQLTMLRGKTHLLVTSAVAVRNNQRLWHYTDTATLTVRSFSDSFLDSYITHTGASVLSSVGAYHLEGLGAQLFSNINGSYFSILGVPLLPVLMFLRTQNFLET
jgi:septum formation protein